MKYELTQMIKFAHFDSLHQSVGTNFLYGARKVKPATYTC